MKASMEIPGFWGSEPVIIMGTASSKYAFYLIMRKDNPLNERINVRISEEAYKTWTNLLYY